MLRVLKAYSKTKNKNKNKFILTHHFNQIFAILQIHVSDWQIVINLLLALLLVVLLHTVLFISLPMRKSHKIVKNHKSIENVQKQILLLSFDIFMQFEGVVKYI